MVDSYGLLSPRRTFPSSAQTSAGKYLQTRFRMPMSSLLVLGSLIDSTRKSHHTQERRHVAHYYMSTCTMPVVMKLEDKVGRLSYSNLRRAVKDPHKEREASAAIAMVVQFGFERTLDGAYCPNLQCRRWRYLGES